MSDLLTTEKLQRAWRESQCIAESSENDAAAVKVSSLPASMSSDDSETSLQATAEVLQRAWRESQPVQDQ